jgi:hypothetical protein
MTGTGGDISPQMWHFDGTFTCLAAVGVLPKPGINGDVAVRDSTEFVRYAHKRLTEFDTDQAKMDYLDTVWNRIRRVRVTTQNEHDSVTRQDEIEEVLSVGSEKVSWPTRSGDMSVFFTDHLHRGASSNGIGYAYFCAWEVPENKARTHTDGVPVQYTNWKTQYESAFKQLAEDAVAELKFKKDDERTARALQRRV